MIELLSLPRRPPAKLCWNGVSTRTGLPFNSLPGWELIPLNCKLPMLKCPSTQVTFTKDKIGTSFKFSTHDFDTSTATGHIPEYNPLHDPNLKTFYSNERNLIRLRENGEITESNYVICTLKDFNEYRTRLHKSRVEDVMRELNRRQEEQLDRMMVAHAEAIRNYDHEHLDVRTRSRTELMSRKQNLENKRKHQFALMLKNTMDLIERHQAAKTMERAVLQRTRILHQLEIIKHQDVKRDLQRTRLIHFKKMAMCKMKHFRRAVRTLAEARIKKATATEIARWQKRMDERIENQKRIDKLQMELNEHQNAFIENHRKYYQRKWKRIQAQIKQRSKARVYETKGHKRSIAVPEVPRGSCIEFQSVFDNLHDNELTNALKIALDEETLSKLPIHPDDPTYKAARFIIQHIVATYDRDLSNEMNLFNSLFQRVNAFLDEAMQFVLFRSTQIISTLNECEDQPEKQSPAKTRVSFNNISNMIGISSYEIHPFADLKDPRERNPTPGGSLASIVDSQQDLLKSFNSEHLTRNDLVFVERLLIQYKREVIVGMGTRVFAAINLHFSKKIMEVRKELVDIDRKFIVNQVAKAILSYAKNSLNLDAITKLSVSSLASNVVWQLQKVLLKPSRDPRGIVKAQRSCKCEAERNKFCLYGH